MTDFLTRMAHAALGLTPTAKVLASSRYAPGVEAVVTQSVSEGPGREEVAVQEVPRAVRVSRPIAHAPEGVRAGEAAPAVEHAAMPVVERAAMPVVGRAAMPVMRRAAMTVADRAAKPVVDRPAMAVVDRTAMPTADRTVTPVPDRAATPAVRRTTVPIVERSQIEQRTPVKVESRTAVPAPVVELVPLPAAVPAAVEARVIERPALALSERAEELPTGAPHAALTHHPLPARGERVLSPPAVRVTIGRVEVRAAAPPPAPREAPAPPAPRISLDDYLRGRTR